MINIFSNPISIIELNQNINFLNKFCLNFKKQNKTRDMSNRGGYQSQNIFRNQFEEIDILLNEIEKHVQIYGKNVLRLKKAPAVNNLWVNINGYKDHNRSHVHPKSIISGVFYIKVPENSGNLMFENANSPSRYLNPEDVEIYNEANSTSWQIIPKENTLILFPSWTIHEVLPNLNKKERISIAFNA